MASLSDLLFSIKWLLIARLFDDLLIIVNGSDYKFMACAVNWRDDSSRKIAGKHLGTVDLSQLTIQASLS